MGLVSHELGPLDKNRNRILLTSCFITRIERSAFGVIAGLSRRCAWGRGTGFGSAHRSQSFSLSYTLADICCCSVTGSPSQGSRHNLHHSRLLPRVFWLRDLPVMSRKALHGSEQTPGSTNGCVTSTETTLH